MGIYSLLFFCPMVNDLGFDLEVIFFRLKFIIFIHMCTIYNIICIKKNKINVYLPSNDFKLN